MILGAHQIDLGQKRCPDVLESLFVTPYRSNTYIGEMVDLSELNHHRKEVPTMAANPIRVFLIDDHPIVEAGLRLGFDLTKDFKLIGMALTPDEALSRIEDLVPDVIVSDLVIQGELDLSYIQHYRLAAPQARVVAFSSLSPDAYAEKCIAAGAHGFISKSTSPHELVEALRAVLGDVADTVPAPDPVETRKSIALDGMRLTAREEEVADRLARGLSIQAIADELSISKKTVSIHRDNLRGKLNCATSTELIALLARSSGTAVV